MNRAKSVLIVEDNGEIRSALEELLHLEGYEVRTAENGRDGLNVAKRMSRPALILADVMMPVMGGTEFIRTLLATEGIADIPVVLISAANENELPPGACAFVQKPFDLERLVWTVDRFCR